MDNKKILLVARGSLQPEDIETLRGQGFVVVQSSDPKNVKVVSEFDSLTDNEMLKCALEALAYGNDRTTANAFGDLIRKKLLDKIKVSTNGK